MSKDLSYMMRIIMIQMIHVKNQQDQELMLKNSLVNWL